MPSIQKKVCLLGEFAVGKTSLIHRFVEGIFSDKYLSTIGTKISRKQLNIHMDSQVVELKMLIWDLAGGEKFGALMKNYYRGAAGALLVCDLTRPETLLSLSDYAFNFWKVNPQVPLVVVGNKADLLNQRVITDAEMARMASQLDVPWFLGSAKTGENVETLFQTLGQRILSRNKATQEL